MILKWFVKHPLKAWLHHAIDRHGVPFLVSLNIKVLNSQDNHFQGEKAKLYTTPCLLLPDMQALLDFLQLVPSPFDVPPSPKQ